MFALIDKWKAAVTDEVQAKRQSRDHSLDHEGNVAERPKGARNTGISHHKNLSQTKQITQ